MLKKIITCASFIFISMASMLGFAKDVDSNDVVSLRENRIKEINNVTNKSTFMFSKAARNNLNQWKWWTNHTSHTSHSSHASHRSSIKPWSI